MGSIGRIEKGNQRIGGAVLHPLRTGKEGSDPPRGRSFSNLPFPDPIPSETPTRTLFVPAIPLRSTFRFRTSSFPHGSGGGSFYFGSGFGFFLHPDFPFYFFRGVRIRLEYVPFPPIPSIDRWVSIRHVRRRVRSTEDGGRRCIRHHRRHLDDDGERHANAREDGVRATKGRPGNARSGANEEERNPYHESKSRRWRGGRTEEEEPRRPLQRRRQCECKRRRNPSPSRWSNDRMTQRY